MKLNARQKRRRGLLLWRRSQYSSITPTELADSLSCESLRYEEVPYFVYKALVEFRHLRTDARVAACKAFLKSEWWKRRENAQ